LILLRWGIPRSSLFGEFASLFGRFNSLFDQLGNSLYGLL